eukprot:2790190-Lingulodinium_polyedra.AAC.1
MPPRKCAKDKDELGELLKDEFDEGHGHETVSDPQDELLKDEIEESNEEHNENDVETHENMT